MIHPCSNLSGGLAKPPLNVGHGWGITPHIMMWMLLLLINTLRPRQNGRHFADDIFKCIFLNENVCIPIKISMKFVPKSPINNIPALVQIMAWRRPGDKPLSEPMMVSLPTHIWVTRPQWVKTAPYKSMPNQERRGSREERFWIGINNTWALSLCK